MFVINIHIKAFSRMEYHPRSNCGKKKTLTKSLNVLVAVTDGIEDALKNSYFHTPSAHDRLSHISAVCYSVIYTQHLNQVR
ncbi:hypothetical protein scyTo_0000215 [Scyliorhinus torazame]|uniref:Uncharacterized protein n=1 Tax=Scyliorhinus torazame TaxID=75743 RepID=A0A401NSW2_SCYTO|nr:hypothetical protein [Scyliorhinus torazame]